MKCRFCNRDLRSSRSIEKGYGHNCEKKNRTLLNNEEIVSLGGRPLFGDSYQEHSGEVGFVSSGKKDFWLRVFGRTVS